MVEEEDAEGELGGEELEKCRAIWAALSRGGEILEVEEASVGVEGKIPAHACRFR
jgi:hypothetical protein